MLRSHDPSTHRPRSEADGTNGRQSAFDRFRVHVEGFIYLLEDFTWILLLGPLEDALDSHPPLSGDRVGHPIVAVHGFGQTMHVYHKMRRYMKTHGREFHLFNYFTPESIKKTVGKLDRYVDRVLEKTGAEKVDLIGHSLGGLVVRYYVQAGGGSRKVSTCITLGAPHDGTRISPYLPVIRSMAEMSRTLRESRFCRELNAMEKPAGVRFINIYSPNDFFVRSKGRGSWEEADRNVGVDFVGHLGMIMDYRFFDVLLRELRPAQQAGNVISMQDRHR
ncbi:MAG: alpha/beta fold hydrolase [Nitrospirae bacterium]|nr:alpha/beta fold hydrolase [Nitrospirota bacterium]